MYVCVDVCVGRVGEKGRLDAKEAPTNGETERKGGGGEKGVVTHPSELHRRCTGASDFHATLPDNRGPPRWQTKSFCLACTPLRGKFGTARRSLSCHGTISESQIPNSRSGVRSTRKRLPCGTFSWVFWSLLIPLLYIYFFHSSLIFHIVSSI